MEQNIIGFKITSDIILPSSKRENTTELIEKIEKDITELIETKYKLVLLGGSCDFIKYDYSKIKLKLEKLNRRNT